MSGIDRGPPVLGAFVIQSGDGTAIQLPHPDLTDRLPGYSNWRWSFQRTGSAGFRSANRHNIIAGRRRDTVCSRATIGIFHQPVKIPGSFRWPWTCLPPTVAHAGRNKISCRQGKFLGSSTAYRTVPVIFCRKSRPHADLGLILKFSPRLLTPRTP